MTTLRTVPSLLSNAARAGLVPPDQWVRRGRTVSHGWPTVGDCGRAVTVLPNAPRTRSGGLPDRFHSFVLQTPPIRAANASDPRQWQGSEIDGPAIGRSPELLLSVRDRPSLNLSSMRSQLSERLRKPAEPRRRAVRARRPRNRSPGPTPGSRRSAHGRERCATRAGPLPP